MAEPARLTQPDLVLQQLLALAATNLPALVTAIPGMAAIKTYGIGSPSDVRPEDFPTVRASVTMIPQAKVGGRNIEPHYNADLIVAFKARHTDEAYYDGLRLADLLLQIILANDVNPPYWRYVARGSARMAPAMSEDGEWQGGLLSIEIIGDGVTWT